MGLFARLAYILAFLYKILLLVALLWTTDIIKAELSLL